jgi:N-acetylmuramoyl-L-alanine amidase
MIEKVRHYVDGSASRFEVRTKGDFKISRSFVLEKPFRVVFDLVSEPEEDDSPHEIPEPENDQEVPEEDVPFPQSTPKIEMIKRICIDPGHGGSDLGAVGKSQLKEKDLTLKISQRLKQIIESRLGIRVIMTRTIDSEVSLNSRAAIANNQKAQLFVSIHVNSSYRKAARGSETYFVSLKATDQESYELAQKENDSFEEIDKMAEDNKLKMILWNMAQTEFIKESSKLAEFLQNEMNILLHTRNRGVKQAPFRVLMRVSMPAVLIEVAFISNASEEAKLKRDEFLDRVAFAIYNGISKYIKNRNQLYN